MWGVGAGEHSFGHGLFWALVLLMSYSPPPLSLPPALPSAKPRLVTALIYLKRTRVPLTQLS